MNRKMKKKNFIRQTSLMGRIERIKRLKGYLMRFGGTLPTAYCRLPTDYRVVGCWWRGENSHSRIEGDYKPTKSSLTYWRKSRE